MADRSRVCRGVVCDGEPLYGLVGRRRRLRGRNPEDREGLESGSEYYWMDHRGAVVGTQTDTRPNLDFRQLLRLP